MVKAGAITHVTRGLFVRPEMNRFVGKMEIRLQHVCQRKLTLAGRPAGLALAALWYLGKNEVTPSLIGKIQQKLSVTEFEALKSVTSAMPSWMSDALFKYVRSASAVSFLVHQPDVFSR